MTIFDQLRRDEGVRHGLYRDERGNLTIGVGHLLRGGHDLSDRAIQTILEDDVAATVEELHRTLPWVTRLSDPRHGVLVNMAFNLGVPGLQTFKTMLGALQNQQWDLAAHEVLNSVYATQVGARAHRLAQQLRENRWV